MCIINFSCIYLGRRDRMVVVFTTTYANIVYHHSSRDLESRLWRVYTIQHYVRVCQWLATGRWFSLGPLVSSTHKTDSHDKSEILLKMALNTIIHILGEFGALIIWQAFSCYTLLWLWKDHYLIKDYLWFHAFSMPCTCESLK
jgi:hypothetical protein